MKKILFILPFIATASLSLSAERIVSFTSAKTVYDFVFVGDVVWVGTSGGLFRYQIGTDNWLIRPITSEYPDPSIRALAFSNGNVWSASHDGYLMRTAWDGSEYINTAYVSAGWKITDLLILGPYLVVGSTKGVSLFDMGKHEVVKNAIQLGDFPTAQVYTLTIHDSHLYVGTETGTAMLKDSVQNISKANFYDPSIWKTDTSVYPVHSFLADSTGKLNPYRGLSERYNGFPLTADSLFSVTLHATDTTTIPFGSRVTAMKVLDANKCWLGTEEHFFYYWTAEHFKQITIPGPTFSGVNRVCVDRAGKVWVLPYGLGEGRDFYTPPWWLGINTFDGQTWVNYGPDSIPEMGHMGSSTEARAIMQSRDGKMWFGFKGGQVKSCDPDGDGWMHYCVFGQEQGNGAFVKTEGKCPESDWGKCDAIAQDSLGFMWISSWNNFAGSLLCYDPDPEEDSELTGRYRRFPPLGNKEIIAEVSAIAVDRENNILYATGSGTLNVAQYTGNPIKEGITIDKTFTGLQKVYDIVVLPEGVSLVLAAGGVFQFNPEDGSFEANEDFENGITSMDVENANVIWYGVPGKGVVRHDFLNDEKTVVGRAQGLMSEQVNDVCVDTKNGYVWIASDYGLSRLTLGYGERPATGDGEVVFPNPYSRSRHSVITFQNVPQGATVRVHGLNGNLVGKPELVRKSTSGSYFQWKPPSHLTPGTYFYAIVTSDDRTTGKLIVTR